MPTYYRHDHDGVVTCFAEGNYTFEDTFNNYKAALSDPRSAEGINVLVDVRKSNETRTSQEMQSIVDLFSSSPNFKGRCAVLVSEDSSVRFGLARMMSMLADSQGMVFSAFKDEAEALAWLTDVRDDPSQT